MTGHTQHSILIGADIEAVWLITNQLHRWPDLFTEYSSVEVIEHDDNTWLFRLTMHPDANGNAWSWVSERTLYPERHQVKARRIETGWFEYMNITWTYEAVPTGTVMRWTQKFSMRSDSPLDDDAMAARIDGNTPGQMEHIRAAVLQLVESDAFGREDALK